MRFITKQMSWWRIVLIIGVAAIALPIAARVSPTAKAVVKERQDYLDRLDLQTTADNEAAFAKHNRESKAAVGAGVARPQDDYYDRRRQYWEKRIERDLDDEDMDDGDDKDADSKDSKAKDSKAAADDDEDGDDVDKEIERRRNYWRKRLDDTDW